MSELYHLRRHFQQKDFDSSALKDAIFIKSELIKQYSEREELNL
jgi:hypothetical protein